MPLIVGVTGPIGSGKSSVSSYLSKKGFKVLDADKIVHSLYKEESVKEGLKKMFGKNVLKDNEVDYKALLSIVSKDTKKKKELEGYIHPLVYKKMDEDIRSGKYKKVVVDVPLLIGGPMEKECDLIIYVEADKDIRMERLIKRNVDPKKFLELNDSFPTRKAKKAASIILDGSGSLDELYKQLDHLALF